MLKLVYIAFETYRCRYSRMELKRASMVPKWILILGLFKDLVNRAYYHERYDKTVQKVSRVMLFHSGR